MRHDDSKRYAGSKFATEKLIATLYAVMFVAILGLGVYKHLDRIKPGGLGPTATVEATER